MLLLFCLSFSLVGGCEYRHEHTVAAMWRSDHSSVESVLHLYLSFRDQTQVLYPVSHLTSPKIFFFLLFLQRGHLLHLFILVLCIWFCLLVYICIVCVQVPEEAQRSRILGSWSWWWAWTSWYGCWGMNSGPQQEETMLGHLSVSQSLVSCCVLQSYPWPLHPESSRCEKMFSEAALLCWILFQQDHSSRWGWEAKGSLQRRPGAAEPCSLTPAHWNPVSGLYLITSRALGISHCHCWLETVSCIGHWISVAWKYKRTLLN